MPKPSVTINLVVYNGEKYIRQCLDSVLGQSYPHELIELNILDNASDDSTTLILESLTENLKLKIKNCSFLKIKTNVGMWPGQDRLLKQSHGQYVLVLSVDIILDDNFIEEAIKTFEKDPQIGAIEGKIYNYSLQNGEAQLGRTIDTCGFTMFRSREINNVGHGEEDIGQFNEEKEIFAVEGAAPVFRRTALEDSRIEGNLVDPEYFWYGDDLDLAWRIRLLGWKQFFSPRAIAYHDRKTTKKLSGNNKLGFIKMRKTLSMFKRRLGWRNETLTIIKNDFAINWLIDLPKILWRQIPLLGYFLIFEPVMIIEFFNVVKLLPKMLKRRREIMRKARVSAKEFRKWII